MQSVLIPDVRCFAQRFTPATAITLQRYTMASALRNETPEQRKARKEEVKAQKADKRARREGHVPEDYGQKACSICKQQKDLLIRCEQTPEWTCGCIAGAPHTDHSLVLPVRCQIDKTETWHMVCGKCWRTVSGGVVDGDDAHPDYRCVVIDIQVALASCTSVICCIVLSLDCHACVKQAPMICFAIFSCGMVHRYGGLWKNLHKADRSSDHLHRPEVQVDELEALEANQ